MDDDGLLGHRRAQPLDLLVGRLQLDSLETPSGTADRRGPGERVEGALLDGHPVRAALLSRLALGDWPVSTSTNT
ncbi:hypothetical protein OHA25_07285 [Nonomuraea sp. NBC_00507]|uniref:hypothetical protein n=1 Tax=Nonomuraea sp. NBC_00507 TaxID=2976002 RepID=UPI002E18B05A